MLDFSIISGLFWWKHLQSSSNSCVNVGSCLEKKQKNKHPVFIPSRQFHHSKTVSLIRGWIVYQAVPQPALSNSAFLQTRWLLVCEAMNCGTRVTGVMVFHKSLFILFFVFVKMVFGTLSNTHVTYMYIINMYFNLLMSYNKYDQWSWWIGLFSCFLPWITLEEVYLPCYIN